MQRDQIDDASVRVLFEAGLEVKPGERESWLASRVEDSALRGLILRMLRADDATGGVIDTPAESHARTVPERIGPFLIEGPLGEGGMGVVYRARQRNPARPVAVKVMRVLTASPSAEARFRLEAEVLGRLQHPNIAQVFSSGVHQDGTHSVPYLVMELVDGADIVSHAATNRLTTRSRVQLLVNIADAAHHAHQRGVIHRDLKPSNVLVTHDGVPKILDFGVARASDVDTSISAPVTVTGQVVGTVRYMAPEQVEAGGAPDVRSDVYALGVLACELLTGEMPYAVPTSSLAAAALAIGQSPPSGLSRIDGPDRAALRAVIRKSLEKRPDDRYQSAAAFRDDLQRVITGRPINARRLPTRIQIARYARRNRKPILAASAAAVAATAVLTAIYLVAIVRPRVAQERWHDAYSLILSDTSIDAMWNLMYWGDSDPHLEYDDGPAPLMMRIDQVEIIELLSEASRLMPENTRISLERDIMRYAADLASEKRDVAPPELLLRRAPVVVEHGRAWMAKRDIPRPDDAILEALDDESLRALGLFAYVTSDAETALRAFRTYEERVEPDPFADAIAGLVYITAQEPIPAYPRLRRAYEVFPENDLIRTYLADAAIQVGDVERGERYFRGAAGNQLSAHDRLRAQAMVARGEHDAMFDAFKDHGTNPFLRLFAYRTFEERHGARLTFEQWATHFRSLEPGYNQCFSTTHSWSRDNWPTDHFHATLTERWWNALTVDERLALADAARAWTPIESIDPCIDTTRPDIHIYAHAFLCGWRDVFLATRDPVIRIPIYGGERTVRPDDEFIELHQRWSREVQEIPEDLGDATIAQFAVALTREGLLWPVEKSPAPSHALIRGKDNPWTGAPATHHQRNADRDDPVWWIGQPIRKE